MNILLIGNSSINKKKELGYKIDNEFDLVFRMNRYEVKDYERWIGKRTDVWILNRALSTQQARVALQSKLVNEPHAIVSDSNSWTSSIQNVFKDKKRESDYLKKMMLVTFFKDNSDFESLQHKTENISESFEMADTRNISKYLRKKWDEKMDKVFYKPPTGLLSIHYLIEKYGKIYIHNFDNGKSKHYWGDKDRQSEPMESKHDWSFDEIVIDELIEEGKVKYL
tara:strand:- start:2033 stop:2704 length:672 start_codon:yes stop_codon:yes gene_type:complete